MAILKAGAASVMVRLGEDCFPNVECVGLHDNVYVRLLILESDHRFAILSADMPSMFSQELQLCKELLNDIAGIEPEYSWVTVSHSFSAPHAWQVGDNHVPPLFKSRPEMIPVAHRINKAYREAYIEAITKALNSMECAFIGFGSGTCTVNVNRNIETIEGWWQGANQEGFADRALSVVRVNRVSGDPIAILYNYSVQPSVTAGGILPNGDKLMSADLPGAAGAYIEHEYKECTAIFLPGATGDQVPMYRINYCETDREGRLRTGCLGEAGYVLMEEQGRMLGNAVVNVAERIRCDDNNVQIKTASADYVCQCRKKEHNADNTRPSHSYSYIPDGECTLAVHGAVIGDIAMVGLMPEMDGITIAEIREASPFSKLIVSTFVNGSMKTMPQRSAYSLSQYAAVNSPFVEGSAELTRNEAINLLRNINS